MKKSIFILLLLLSLVLSACGKPAVYTVEKQGMTFTLDTENCTITQNGNVYRYEIEQGNATIKYTITYPDGATYRMNWSGGIGTSGGNALYNDEPRLDGNILIAILREELASRKAPDYILVSLLCIGLGIFNAAAPKAVCYLRRGWRYKNAEPSEAYVALTQISGIALIIGGVILLFI